MRKLLLLLFVVLLAACSQPKPVFDSTRAFSYLQNQVDFGPRVPGSDAHQLCQQYLSNQLKRWAQKTGQQTFEAEINGQTVSCTNLIASWRTDINKRVLLTAHWDSRPWADQEKDLAKRHQPVPGANNGASGVAVLLELAQMLNQAPPSGIGVDIVLFDASDAGAYGNNANWSLGAKHFAKVWPGKTQQAIVLDMIGDKDLNIPLEAYSYEKGREIYAHVLQVAKDNNLDQFSTALGPKVYFDHVPLIEAGYSTALLMDPDYPAWHTTNDTPEQCSPASLNAVGQVLTELIWGEHRL